MNSQKPLEQTGRGPQAMSPPCQCLHPPLSEFSLYIWSVCTVTELSCSCRLACFALQVPLCIFPAQIALGSSSVYIAVNSMYKSMSFKCLMRWYHLRNRIRPCFSLQSHQPSILGTT